MIFAIIKQSDEFNDIQINGKIEITQTLNTYIETVVSLLEICKNESIKSDKVNLRDPVQTLIEKYGCHSSIINLYKLAQF